jgi:signal transduction histidine kinase/DNA-binding response OmpR family regulator/HPt (histidine-containing phosphotransfer) domain-containing protein
VQNIRIKHKLFIAFFLIALMGAAVALMNLVSARQLSQGVSSIGHNFDKVRAIMVVHDHVQRIMAAEMRLLGRDLTRDERQAHYRVLEEGFAGLETQVRTYEGLVRQPEEKQRAALFYEHWQEWRQQGEAYLELCRRLDATDIIDPLAFQNSLFQKKEEAYDWILALQEAVNAGTVFTGELKTQKGGLGGWLFSFSSENSSLAVAVGKARKSLTNLYSAGRKINGLTTAASSASPEMRAGVFAREVMPARGKLLDAFDLMLYQADKAAVIYDLKAAKVDELSRLFAGLNDQLKQLTAMNSEQAAAIVAGGSREMSMSSRVSLGALVVGLGGVFLLSVLLGKFITRPLVELHKGIERFMKTGDFACKVQVEGNDEVAQVGRSFNDMVDRLHFYYQELATKNEALAEAREELASSNGELVGTNEELTHRHAELQATNSELARRRDELQEANTELIRRQAELAAANTEMTATTAALQQSNADLAAAQIGLAERCQGLEAKVAHQADELARCQAASAERAALVAAGNDALARQYEAHGQTLAALDKATEVAAAADRAKAAFLANMGHEIRTPMNAIIGLTSLALRQEVPDKVREYLRTVQKSGRDLLQMLDGILDFSKMEHGHFERQELDFILEDLLENIKDLFAPRARDKNLEFEIRTSAEVPPQLRGDALRLGQVLGNLLDNALKFTDRGRIGVVVAVQEERGDEVDLLFTVSDTGIGIDEGQQGRLFEAFSQVDGSISRPFGGTGLGLALSKKIVENNGGQLWLESVVGRGSSFHFTFCCRSRGQAAMPWRYREIFAGHRVLVVDDNPMFRHFMAKMFTSFGFEVTGAASGEQALEKLQGLAQHHALPQVILLDQGMPGMDGLQLVSHLAGEPTWAAIPIIMISADGQDADLRQRAEAAGVRAVLSKPVKRELLLDCLEGVLQGGAAVADDTNGVAGHDLLAGRRVLLVDDNSISRQVVGEMLATVGVQVVTAVDGDEALATAAQDIAAVLLDVRAPGLHGLEISRRLRRQPELAELPIIAMTGRTMRDTWQKCQDAGITGYIAKPLEPEALYQVLRDICGVEEAGETPPASKPSGPAVGLILPGIDTVSALARINNNRTLFKKLLAEFATDNESLLAELNSAVQAGELDRAIGLVHTLKGVAGNLGAGGLQKAAAAVEQGLRRQGRLASAPLAELGRCLQEVMEGVRQAVGPARPGPGTALPLPGPGPLQLLMKTLLAHIEANTPRAEKYLQELPLSTNSVFEQGRQEIMARLVKFDFEAARASLIHLAATMGVRLDGK